MAQHTMGTANSDIQFTNPQSTGITIPSNQYITQISLNLSTSTGWWRNLANDTRSMKFYCRNSNTSSNGNWNGEYDLLCTITLDGNTTNYGTTAYKSWTLSKASGLKYSGKTIYFQGVQVDSVDSTQSIKIRNATSNTITVTITTATVSNPIGAVRAGDPIYKHDLTQKGVAADDAQLIKYRAYFAANTPCTAAGMNTFLGVS